MLAGAEMTFKPRLHYGEHSTQNENKNIVEWPNGLPFVFVELIVICEGVLPSMNVDSCRCTPEFKWIGWFKIDCSGEMRFGCFALFANKALNAGSVAAGSCGSSFFSVFRPTPSVYGGD